jgi:Zn ribbon nucleic-acid-binding protein
MKRALIPITAIIVLGMGTAAFTQSFSVSLGSRKGPAQPVNFNHQIHAGRLGMDCLYCHFGADKSKVAGIPPVSTCMGCHKIAATDRPEVQKLTGYYDRREPIPWVRVHQLPDYVRFDHKRHVRAGVQCATCHGPVQDMAVMYQYSSLKMGWCVTCHRQNQTKSEYTTTTSMDCLVCHH